MKRVVLKLIKFYQRIFSPDHGVFKEAFPFGFCRFKPTCSEYTYGCIEKFGLIKGGSMGFWRILRCNPFSRGGYDPVPQKLKTDYFAYGFISLIIYLSIILSLFFLIIKLRN